MASIVENTKNAIVEFKLQFLHRLSTKSRFQTLCGCENECIRGWNRDTREGRCLNRSIGLISISNGLEIGRTSLFIQIMGVTVRWISIDGLSETVHREPFHLNRGCLILMEGLDLIHVDKRYITHLIAIV